MVYLEGPGEEFIPRESSSLNDHERHAIDRFRCPVCDAPLELIESLPRVRHDAIADVASEDSRELIAVCRLCDVSFTRDDWHAWLRAV